MSLHDKGRQDHSEEEISAYITVDEFENIFQLLSLCVFEIKPIHYGNQNNEGAVCCEWQVHVVSYLRLQFWPTEPQEEKTAIHTGPIGFGKEKTIING